MPVIAVANLMGLVEASVFPDVARLVQKLRENNCTLKDLVDCYRGLTIVTFIAKLLRPGAPPPPSKPSQTTSVMPIMGLQDLRWRQHAVWELGEGAEEAKGHNDEGQGSSTEDSPSKPHFIDWRPLACSHDSATALSNIVEGLHDISEDGAKFLALIEETIDQETMVRLLCSCATANTSVTLRPTEVKECADPLFLPPHFAPTED